MFIWPTTVLMAGNAFMMSGGGGGGGGAGGGFGPDEQAAKVMLSPIAHPLLMRIGPRRLG